MADSPDRKAAEPLTMFRGVDPSTPTTPIDGFWLGTSRHFVLPPVEGSQDFLLLTLGHAEVIKRAAKLRSDLVERFGWNLQVEMGVAQL